MRSHLMIGLLACCSVVSYCQSDKQTVIAPPVSDRDRALLLKAYSESEKDMVGVYSYQAMGWLVEWIGHHKEYAGRLTKIGEWATRSNPEKIQPAVMRHFLLASTAFKLENPASLNDENAVDASALSSLIRAYKKTIEREPSLRTSNMDRLVTLDAQGKIPEVIIELNKKLSKQLTQPA